MNCWLVLPERMRARIWMRQYALWWRGIRVPARLRRVDRRVWLLKARAARMISSGRVTGGQ